MDRTDDGRDGTEGDPPPGTFFQGGEPYPVGSPEHQALVTEATGAGVSYLPKATVTLQSGGNHMEIAGYIVDPPGYEGVPLPVNTALTIALGRKIRVVMMGEERWFKTWSVPNTLINDSPETTETFRLGNATQTVAALKRGYYAVTVNQSTYVKASCIGVGPLSAAIYWDLDTEGRKRYFTPEGTYPMIVVGEGQAEDGMSCTVSHMRATYGSEQTHTLGDRSAALFNPKLQTTVTPGSCCWSWDEGNSLCRTLLSTGSHHVNTAGCERGGRVLISPWSRLYTVGWSTVWASPEATFPVDFYYQWEGQPGYQHVRTYISDKDGGLLEDSTPPLLGKGEFITSSANLPIGIRAVTAEKSKLSVDIRVDDIRPNMTIAQAGCFRGIDNSLKSRYRLPIPLIASTELVGIQALPNPGFVFVRWTGDCTPLDSNGTIISGVSLDADADPTYWYTNPVIYVKCIAPFLEGQDVNLTAVMRPCTHCGHGSSTDVHMPRGTTVGGLAGAERLYDGMGYSVKPNRNDMFGCRWYIHSLIKEAGEGWEQYRQANPLPDPDPDNPTPPESRLLPTFYITGVSLQNGGYRHPSHSHQNGRDVDVRYILARGALNVNGSEQLIRLFLGEQCTAVYVGISSIWEKFQGTPEEGGDSRVKWDADHDDHFHVAFSDPDGVPPDDPCPPCLATYY